MVGEYTNPLRQVFYNGVGLLDLVRASQGARPHMRLARFPTSPAQIALKWISTAEVGGRGKCGMMFICCVLFVVGFLDCCSQMELP